MIEVVAVIGVILTLPLLCLCASGVARPTRSFSGSNDPYSWMNSGF